MKTKVVRAEILHILVGLTARGDPYLIVSWTFGILAQVVHISEDPGFPRRENRAGLQAWGKGRRLGAAGWFPMGL